MAQSYAGFIAFYIWIRQVYIVPVQLNTQLISKLDYFSHSFPRPPAKRAVALAFINAFGQLGNIVGA